MVKEKKALFSVVVGAHLSSVFQTLQPFGKGGLWVRQPGARQELNFIRTMVSLLCDLR